jgi:hypothetical protein
MSAFGGTSRQACPFDWPATGHASFLGAEVPCFRSVRSGQRSGRPTLKMCLVPPCADTRDPNVADAADAKESTAIRELHEKKEKTFSLSRCAY